jgi:iron-sulfur cluster assembly protein/iron-sulfur cluster insertion protein
MRSKSTLSTCLLSAVWHLAPNGVFVTISTMGVTLTDSAVSKVCDLLSNEAEPGMRLRISVKSGGCSGFSYDMFFDSDLNPRDEIFSFDTVQVVCDAESLKLLTGATLDYTDSISGAGFKITNPNASRTCGCGNSFC